MEETRDITAPCGRVRAYVADDVIRARGIRYASARRFLPPVDEPPVDFIDGGQPGPASPQLRRDPNAGMTFDQLGGLPISEDCLRVSVTMPKDTTPRRPFPSSSGSTAEPTSPGPGMRRSTTRTPWPPSRTSSSSP